MNAQSDDHPVATLRADDPKVAEINQHLDTLLGMEARKPGAAASLPAVIRIIETLEPAGGKHFPVFPPSYAGEGTNAPPVYDLNGIEYGEMLQEKSGRDGTKRVTRYIKSARHCTMDSPQSHANRTEIAFLEDSELRPLVPEVTATIPRRPELAEFASTNVLNLPHRVADFRVRASHQGAVAEHAIHALAQGDALPLLRLMPTSIVFGFWDSRAEGYQHKHARILMSRIDAFTVIPCVKHSLYTGPYSKDECASVVLGNEQLAAELAKQETQSDTISEEEKQKASDAAKAWMDAMSARGFTSAPSKGLGGIIAEEIKRLSLISLTDIARLFCKETTEATASANTAPTVAEKPDEAATETAKEESADAVATEAKTKSSSIDATLTNAARRYVLALALLAENFPRSTGSYRLRSGCELIPTGTQKIELLGGGSDTDATKALKALCTDRELLIKVAKSARDILRIEPRVRFFAADAASLKADLVKANKSEKAAERERKAAEKAAEKARKDAEAAEKKAREARQKATEAEKTAAELTKEAEQSGVQKELKAAEQATEKARQLADKAT